MKCLIYDEKKLRRYLEDLRLVASLSSLFSENETPFLHYRATEKLYCLNFNAKNVARDSAVDATLSNFGIGIKTFIRSKVGNFQKIAEFDKQRSQYENLGLEEKIQKISELRNARLDFALREYEIEKLVYHCILRSKGKLFLFEETMNFIDIPNIRGITLNKSSYLFSDSLEDYKFDISKSTLYKKFITAECFDGIDVSILENPIEELRKLKLEGEAPGAEQPYPKAVIPLYSTDRNGKKLIYEKSGLNQWNADGRPRDPNEVYIPFPSNLRTKYYGFFPPKETPFEVTLPSGRKISMKLCQQDSKAIMSNPNKALGEWLLRNILKIPKKKLIVYEDLLEVGIDSVCFSKIDSTHYLLNFMPIGSFEKSMKS